VRAILLIARRELAGYLETMSGYVILAGVLAVNGLFFQSHALGGNKLSAEVLSTFFYDTSGFTMVAAVLISMRLLAEERQAGTISLLYSSPVRDSEIVLGKYLSGLAFFGLYLACTLFMPALILIHGKVSLGHLFVGYLGLGLLGSACLAIGTFGSALAKNQLLAAVISACLVVTLLVAWLLAKMTDRPFAGVLTAAALYQKHFPPFGSGVLHVRDVVYYLAVTYVGLFAATRVLEARRWK
jgi:ABC-2 type transport system permease protein